MQNAKNFHNRAKLFSLFPPLRSLFCNDPNFAPAELKTQKSTIEYPGVKWNTWVHFGVACEHSTMEFGGAMAALELAEMWQ